MQLKLRSLKRTISYLAIENACINKILKIESNQLGLQRNYGMGGSPGDVSEESVTQEKRKKGWSMNCDVSEATEGLENEL